MATIKRVTYRAEPRPGSSIDFEHALSTLNLCSGVGPVRWGADVMARKVWIETTEPDKVTEGASAKFLKDLEDRDIKLDYTESDTSERLE